MINMIEIIKRSITYKAIAIIGSRARGNYGPNSDWDYIAICDSKNFIRINEMGTVIEIHCITGFNDFINKPSWWYALKTMKCVDGDPELISRIQEIAFEKFNKYTTDKEVVKSNIEWLMSSKRKIMNATDQIDSEFQMASAMWELFSSYFHKENKPIPANGDMLFELNKIANKNEINDLLTLPWRERKKLYIRLIDEKTPNKSMNRSLRPGYLRRSTKEE